MYIRLQVSINDQFVTEYGKIRMIPSLVWTATKNNSG